MSQVYYHQNKRDHPGGGVPVVSLARVSVAPGRTGVSEWMVRLGRQSQAFPGAGCRRKGCHITPLLPGQARLLWSGTEVGLSGCLRNNQVYQLRAVALGLRARLPPAQHPSAVHWLLSLDTLGARDDKDLLWEALISSPSYALGLALGAGPWGSWPGDS